MRLSLTALGLLILFAANAAGEESAAPKTRAQALAVLAPAESYDEEAVGFAGTKSATFLAYEFLRESSKVKDWIEWTRHKSPVVRCYAVRALAEAKAGVQLRAAVFKGLSDTARVNHFQGCCVGEVYVADVIVGIGLANLDQKDQQALRDKIMAGDVPLLAREHMLWTGGFDTAQLPRVLELARAGSLHALRGLAKHKHPEAVAMIVRFLREPSKGSSKEGSSKEDADAVEGRIHAAVISVMGWPDARFWSGLTRLRDRAAGQLNHNWVRDYMHAVAGYENGAAAAILTHLLDVDRGAAWKQRLTEQKVLNAINKHRVESFASLRRRLSGS